jgi:hypothetical protein
MLTIPLFLVATTNPEQYLYDYIRVRSDVSGSENVYHLTGNVYSMIPGEKSMELFAYEGYGITKIQQSPKGYKMLAKEVGLLLDHRTLQILENWRNPFTQQQVPVIHIWNDPINQSFEYSNETLPYISRMFPADDLGDKMVFHNEIFPFYPHILSRREYGLQVQSDYFQSAELSQYTINKEDLADSLALALPAEIYQVWISPWLPFMNMGDREGNLIFVLRGKKLSMGFEELPERLKLYVQTNAPEFSKAPTLWSEPNMNPWLYFKQLREQNNEESER